MAHICFGRYRIDVHVQHSLLTTEMLLQFLPYTFRFVVFGNYLIVNKTINKDVVYRVAQK